MKYIQFYQMIYGYIYVNVLQIINCFVLICSQKFIVFCLDNNKIRYFEDCVNDICCCQVIYCYVYGYFGVFEEDEGFDDQQVVGDVDDVDNDDDDILDDDDDVFFVVVRFYV